jgi:pimeloyl-ACP methyl ester carboxylesterase
MAWPHVYNLDVKDLDNAATTTRRTGPAMVIVHDAFHGPAHFESLAAELNAAGLEVVIPQLASASSTYVPRAFEADVYSIFNTAKRLIQAGKDVVLVMHGYGALTGSMAADHLNRHSLNIPRAGEVIKLIFLAGAIVEPQSSYQDLVRPYWTSGRDGLSRVAQPGQLFFHDCGLEPSRTASEQIVPQVTESLQAGVRSPGWTSIPSLYVVCALDRAIPPAIQHECLRRLQEQNRETSAVSLHSGHAPFLSRVRQTATIIINAARQS